MTEDEYAASIHDIVRDAGLPAALADRLAAASVSGTTLRNAIHDAGDDATAASVLSHPGLSGQLGRGKARASSAPASAPAATEPRRAPKVTESRVALPPIAAPTPPAPPPKPGAIDRWREAARLAGVPLKDPE